jgi:hypothetical protein
LNWGLSGGKRPTFARGNKVKGSRAFEFGARELTGPEVDEKGAIPLSVYQHVRWFDVIVDVSQSEKSNNLLQNRPINVPSANHMDALDELFDVVRGKVFPKRSLDDVDESGIWISEAAVERETGAGSEHVLHDLDFNGVEAVGQNPLDGDWAGRTEQPTLMANRKSVEGKTSLFYLPKCAFAQKSDRVFEGFFDVPVYGCPRKRENVEFFVVRSLAQLIDWLESHWGAWVGVVQSLHRRNASEGSQKNKYDGNGVLHFIIRKKK